ncbi:catalase [Massilia antarctica]
MMQGFGVHTFKLVNVNGDVRLCKFHWTPLQGTHSLVWDEAVKLRCIDTDFHRRDLWEAIEAGNVPEYELGLQVFTEDDAATFPFDILDPTKLVPEELVPVFPVGKLVLNRNPDNFFTETEQVAFCTQHIVPGIDFTNDPILQGRNHSYLDTQLSRLGGPNVHEIPINLPLAEVHNNQREGFHRQTVNRGRGDDEPNSLAGGCPFQAGRAGFVSVPDLVAGNKVGGKPELFADHYSQARLFWISQSAPEQAHIIEAFRFELTRVETLAIRVRMVAGLLNVDAALARAVAAGLGIAVPAPLPLATTLPLPVYAPSPALSLLSRPGVAGIRTRQVAILVASGTDGALARAIYTALLDDGAVPRLLGQRLGPVSSLDGQPLQVEITFEASPSVVYDAMVLPGGDDAAIALGRDPTGLAGRLRRSRHHQRQCQFGGASAQAVQHGPRAAPYFCT